MGNLSELIKAIKEEMDKRDISPGTLAEMMGKPYSAGRAYDRMIRGQTNPRIDTVERCMEVLGLTISVHKNGEKDD